MNRPDLTPLRMAQNCAAGVLRVAELQDTDPTQYHTTGAGKIGKDTAYVGACMALVSMAESLDRIASRLEVDALSDPDPLGEAQSLERIATALEAIQLKGELADND